MTRPLTATYRIQLRREFPLSAGRELVPYLHQLGVSHLYLSPVLAARPGSPHGYDVIDSSRVNPELGTEEDFRALAHDVHARNMGIILDIVPNHMAASEHNPYWDDVLERGRGSRFADWFDIDWDAPHAKGKVILPVLGDELTAVIGRAELKLHIRDSGARLAYFERTFPLDPSTLPKELQLAQLDPAGRPAADAWAAGDQGKSRLRSLLQAQHYRLTFWRGAGGGAAEINYRRFFDISDLVALRMETDVVFDATHTLILSWVRDGIVDGLRIDHIDGLRLPSWYLAKLRDAVDSARDRTRDLSARFPIVVEKILSGDETLPREWPVDGTTGYDFMNDVEELFIEPEGFRAIEANYRGLRHNPSLSFRAVARDAKRRALTGPLGPDVMRVARIARAWRAGASVEEIGNAVIELIVSLEVYRTYVSEPGIVGDFDRRVLSDAFREAATRDGASAAALEMLKAAFFADPAPSDALRAELVTRLQLVSGPATAKGVEDTALYIYVPVASRNEVGGQPDRPLVDVHARVHARNASRARDWPRTLLATNTHDTKRSADLRARLDVLTGMPDEWARHATRWRRLNKPRKRIVRGKPAPDTNSEYLFYQTLLGMWPAPRRERRVDDLPDREWIARARDRLVAYMLKAAREAKMRTSWTESDAQYEKALEAFVRETLEPHEDAPFLPDVARLTAQTANDGFRFSLARVLLQCTAPGIPDVYQGDEIWNFTLVDPDNRRPVDFQLRARLLSEVAPEVLARALGADGILHENTVKLALLASVLRFRREHPALLTGGDYVPIPTGDEALFAFARKSNDEACISLARTRVARRGSRGSTGEPARTVALPDDFADRWQSVLTGRTIELVRGEPHIIVSADDLVPLGQPCELLLRSSR
ncbi:MAG: malto-oligosyltrehalose synthase [Gemmatimonadaceae bacterium]